MAYIETPPWAKYSQRAALSGRYIHAGIIGAWAALGEADQYGPLLAWTGWFLVITSASGLWGVLAHYYRAEWVSLPLLMGALAASAVIVSSRSTMSADPIVVWLVLGLATAPLDRFVHLSRVAWKLRHPNYEG